MLTPSFPEDPLASASVAVFDAIATDKIVGTIVGCRAPAARASIQSFPHGVAAGTLGAASVVRTTGAISPARRMAVARPPPGFAPVGGSADGGGIPGDFHQFEKGRFQGFLEEGALIHRTGPLFRRQSEEGIDGPNHRKTSCSLVCRVLSSSSNKSSICSFPLHSPLPLTIPFSSRMKAKGVTRTRKSCRN